MKLANRIKVISDGLLIARASIGCGSLLVFSLLLAGCGYQFQGSGSILPPDVKRIYIPIVENNSTEGEIGTLVTEALRDQFDRFGVVTVVDSAAGADATLKVRIMSATKRSRSSRSGNDSALERDTMLVMSGELRRNNGGVLWRDPRFTVSKDYATDTSTVVTSSSSFASGGLSSDDLEGLSSREVERLQQADALSILAYEVARKVYDDAVAPDF